MLFFFIFPIYIFKNTLGEKCLNIEILSHKSFKNKDKEKNTLGEKIL